MEGGEGEYWRKVIAKRKRVVGFESREEGSGRGRPGGVDVFEDAVAEAVRIEVH